MIKRRTYFFTALIFTLTLSFSSCKKEPGEGGLATIKGRIYCKDYDKFGNLISEGYLPDENVYISYGDRTVVDNDVNTSYDGSFAFEFLQKGDYTVFAYTVCDTCQFQTASVLKKVHISKMREVVDIGDISIIK